MIVARISLDNGAQALAHELEGDRIGIVVLRGGIVNRGAGLTHDVDSGSLLVAT